MEFLRSHLHNIWIPEPTSHIHKDKCRVSFDTLDIMNFSRKSTIGWSVGNIFLDLTGGVLNFGPMGVPSIDQWELHLSFRPPRHWNLRTRRSAIVAPLVSRSDAGGKAGTWMQSRHTLFSAVTRR